MYIGTWENPWENPLENPWENPWENPLEHGGDDVFGMGKVTNFRLGHVQIYVR